MERFAAKFVLVFSISLGVVLGGAFLSGVAALLMNERPIKVMVSVAGEMKLWAIVAAIGGAFTTMEIFEHGLFKGEVTAAVKQILYIAAALLGAQLAYLLVVHMAGEGQ